MCRPGLRSRDVSEIPAGWYPDPYETPNLYRWWDGVQWTDDTAPMSPQQAWQPAGEHAQAQPQEQWQGAPGWEPRAEPPPWDTQNGPPGVGNAANAGGSPDASPPPLDPFVPRPQLPSDDPSHAGRAVSQPWAPAERAWSQPEADWGQRAHQGPDWGQQGPPPVPPRGPDLGAPSPPRRSRGPLIAGIAGGLALLLVIGVAVGVVLVRRGHQQADTSQSPSAAATSTAPASPQPASPVPTGPRITAGSISYVRLPPAWESNSQLQFPEFDTKNGQYQYTQRNPPGLDGGWIANVFVGSLSSEQFSYGGPDDLKSTAGGLASSVEQKYYKPWKTRRKDLAQKKITVSGKQGYEIKFHLDFLNTPKGFAAKGETVLVAVVDGSTGAQGVYISIPDNAKKLEPTFDLVMNSVQVD